MFIVILIHITLNFQNLCGLFFVKTFDNDLNFKRFFHEKFYRGSTELEIHILS